MQPLEPWIEQLYRRVSDQQTMGSVVQELRSALTEVEKRIDQYFRDPSQREVLVPVPAQLSAMRGVLSVLDLDQASQTVVQMRNAVDELAATEVDPARASEVGTFDRLADNLGALGFLIDMLSVQPALARSLFSFDADSGRLVAATGAPSRLTLPDVPAAPALSDEARQLAQVAVQEGVSDEELSRQLEDLTRRAVVDDQAGLARVAADAQQALEGARDEAERAAARAGLAQAVTELVTPVPVPELPVSAPIPPVRETPTVPGGTGLENDDEMREIFIEEAREVIATARESLRRLAGNSEDVAEITVVRRSFHTLKGSSRMVGLRDFGEAAWACEQVYNARLAEDPRVDPPLAAFSHDALDQMASWVDALADRAAVVCDPLPLVRRGEALRGVAPAPVAAPQPVLPVLPVPSLETRDTPAVPVEPPSQAASFPSLELPPVQERLHEAPLHEAPLEAMQQPLADALPVGEVVASSWAAAGDPSSPADVDPLPALDLTFETTSIEATGLPEGTASFETAPEGLSLQAGGQPVVEELPLSAALEGLGSLSDAPASGEPSMGLVLDFGAGQQPAAPLDVVEPLDAGTNVPSQAEASELEWATPTPAAEEAAEPAPATSADEVLLPVAEVAEWADAADIPAPSESVDVTEVIDAGEPGEVVETIEAIETSDALAAEVLPAASSAEPALGGLEVIDGALADEGLLPVALVEDRTDLPAEEAAPEGGPAESLPSLTERIPDLPSASDLELGSIPSTGDVAPIDVPDSPPTADALSLALSDFDADFPAEESSADPSRSELPPLDVLEEIELPASLDASASVLPEVDPEATAIAQPPMAWSVDLDALDAPLTPAEASGDQTHGVSVSATEPNPLAADAEAEAEADDTPTAWAPPDDAMAGETTVSADGETMSAEPLPDEVQGEVHAVPEVVEEPVKIVGPLRIPIPLFNIFLNEADEQSRRLVTETAEWGLEWSSRPVSESTVALAHSLAGNSATVGYAELSALARALEHALMRSAQQGRGREGEASLFAEAADEIRRLLHQFAAGFLKPAPPALMARLADHEHWSTVEALPLSMMVPTPVAPEPVREPVTLTLDESSVVPASEDEDDLESVDSIDHDLLPIFAEEAEELLPQLQGQLVEWVRHPQARQAPEACLRTLHTFKGGARLAGAMRVGELAHRLETDIEDLLAQEAPSAEALDRLQHRLDRMAALFEATCRAAAEPAAPASPIGEAPAAASPTPEPHDVRLAPVADVPAVPDEPPTAAEVVEAGQMPFTSDGPPMAGIDAPEALPPVEVTDGAAEVAAAAESSAESPDATEAPVVESSTAGSDLEPVMSIDWTRFAVAPEAAVAAPVVAASGASAVVRVRTGLLDRLVNGAGEVSIARSRIESDVRTLQGSLEELTGSLDRMRRELRDIEVQAETQIASRIEAAKASAQAFDPLEMDRFTRLQELTRMMAESVNDVATLQRSLQRTLQSTEDQLAAQSRLTRELQDDLLRTRMVEFESLADRLYRVVRQAAKDLGKQVRLEITGGSIEVDRGVLERMVGPFEHMLRNSVVHGIELPAERSAAGKDPTGTIRVRVSQVGNEVGVEFGDDGRGLDLQRIRERALDRGLLAPDSMASDEDLAQLIFVPGFSTAGTVSELAGRGIGMDVVRSEVNAMGGRIETHSTPQQGARFRLVLPLTTAVTQVVLLGAGGLTVAVPSSLVEVVRRVPLDDVRRAYASGQLPLGDHEAPFFWLPELLDGSGQGPLEGRTQMVVVVQSASQRVALHVEDVIGNQEVVVKNVGPQLSHMPGLAGVTLLPSGAAALIYNPVALAALYGEEISLRRRQVPTAKPEELAPVIVAAPVAKAPLVMVVDDSLTVRRVTQRLLEREGYRVVLAKDGMDALEKLAEVRPIVMLCDIEMPRMDGFELVRVLRSDPERADIPVVMITSRIAQKHRDHASQLGVQHYLGKPYPEDRLLALVAEYASAEATV